MGQTFLPAASADRNVFPTVVITWTSDGLSEELAYLVLEPWQFALASPRIPTPQARPIRVFAKAGDFCVPQPVSLEFRLPIGFLLAGIERPSGQR